MVGSSGVREAMVNMFGSRLSIVLSTVLLISAIVKSEQPTCKRITGYTVCHKKGTLVDVSQNEFEDRLEIHDLDLLAIRENAFKNLTTVKLSLGLGNKISVVQKESFHGLEKLERLDLDSNVVTLSPNLFSELNQLRSLSLIFNKIREIPKYSFAGLSNLMWLYLGHNDIESISRDSFAGLSSSILFLWLNDNKIGNIEPGTFSEMPELTRLHLENNKLTTVKPGALRGLHKLDGLFLEENQLSSVSRTDFKGLIGLRILSLHSNRIADIEPGAFADLAQLEDLQLRKNQLSRIDAGLFDGLNSLKKLDLSSNKISVVESGAFRQLGALKVLYLTNNSLTSVDRDDYGLTSLTMVYAT